ELTSQSPQRRAGQMYAGRTLVVEECFRDLDATVGGPVLEAMAAPLAVLLQAARWLCSATAEAYLAALRDFYTELARDLGSGDFSIGLGELHAAWSTFDAGLFLVGTDRVEELRAAALADIGPGRVLPLFPMSWPRHTSRLSGALDNDSDAQLGFMPGPGADPD